jgi:hypothetical protein
MHPADALTCKLHRPDLASASAEPDTKAVWRHDYGAVTETRLPPLQTGDNVTRLPRFGCRRAKDYLDGSARVQRQPFGWLPTHSRISSRQVGGQVAP